MSIQYRISNILMNVTSDCEYQIERMKLFEEAASDNFNNNDLTINIKQKNELQIKGNPIITDERTEWNLNPTDNSYYTYIFSKLVQKNVATLDIDTDWKKAEINYIDNTGKMINSVDVGKFYTFHMVGVFFRYSILNYLGIVVHASSIKFNEQGIVFTAPAGTGKSTHTRLWEKYLSDQVCVLNDDTPVIRIINGKPFLFGTPWSGSTDKCMNKSVPLSAIVIIERDDKNSIRELSLMETNSRLMPRFFFPYFDKALMDKAVMIYEKIISQVPVYLLKCTPEKEAMDVAYKFIIKDLN